MPLGIFIRLIKVGIPPSDFIIIPPGKPDSQGWDESVEVFCLEGDSRMPAVGDDIYVVCA
jgi:hypothetical protein